jgi:hypothetical protein
MAHGTVSCSFLFCSYIFIPLHFYCDQARVHLLAHTQDLPLLGSFEKGGPHSIVILDNASIHMDEEIVSLIQCKGAYSLCTAAFSSDINPIEKMFVIYKACVKRNQAMMASKSWYDLHVFALGTVTPDIALSEFKKCGFPIKDLNTVKKKTRDYGSSGYCFDHGDCCYYY